MRKKRFILRAGVLLATMLLPLLAAAGVITYTATYDNSKLTLGTDTLGGVTYTTVSYDGLYNGGEPGSPSLPIDYLRFSVPYNAANFSVSTTVRMPVNNSISHLVYPNQRPRPMSDTTPVVINLPDTAAYYSGSIYPSVNAWVDEDGYLAGENHIVTVAVMPIAYSHTTISDKLILSRTVNLTLNYSISDSTTLKPLVRNDSVLRQEGFQLAQSMVVNPNQVIPYAPASPIAIEPLDGNFNLGGYEVNGHGHVGDDPIFPPIDPPQPIDTTLIYTDSLGMGLNYPYLIITTDELLHSMRRLVALKRQKGYMVKIVTLNHVMSDPQAHSGDIIKKNDGTTYVAFDDSAGVIRQYLKKAFKQWGTKYVLLAGTDIPYRCIDSYTLHGSFVPQLPTDLYYSDLTSDFNKPRLDPHPELYVGRLLAKNDNQILNYTDKLLRYELNPGNGDYSYLKRLFYSEGYDMQLDREVSLVHPEYSRIFTDTCHMKEIYQNNYPSGTDIINKINDIQFGYLSIMNHGSPSGFITYGHYNHDTLTNATVYYNLWAIDSVHLVFNNQIYNADTHVNNGMNNLMNKWYPSICYSMGCSTMPFDSMPNYEQVETNIGESFTTGKDYGGPAFLGNTRESSSNQGATQHEKAFANELANGHWKVGECEAFSKNAIPWAYSYLRRVHNLLGDPEFEIWTDIPQLYEGLTITRKDNSISIKGLNGAVPTFVSFVDNEKAPVLRRVSSDSTHHVVSPNSIIMLYKHNYIPYIAPLVLQNTTLSKSQYIIATDIMAGNCVDSKRTPGDVVVSDGVEYEAEISGKAILCDGFKVEKGATFAIYPSCF